MKSVAALLALALLPVAVPSPAAASSAVDRQHFMSKLEWRSVGPGIGGRTVAIAGVPGKNIFYFGGVGGGIWKGTDFGLQWTNISDGTLPSQSNSFGAIAVAPSNPNVIYAGTGESDIRGNIITGDGIYKSTDAGKHWQYAGLRDTHTTSGIVIDPRNPEVLYASSMGHVFAGNPDRGVYKSVDGGKSWKKVLFVNGATGAISLAMDNAHPQTLYAAMWQAQRTPWSLTSGGPGSGLYKTTDGGAHWTNLTHTPGYPQGVLGRIGVSVVQSKPNVVYSIVQAKHGGVFRSNDGGASWKRVNSGWNLRQRAFYYMSIFADPTNANTVYVPEVDGLLASYDGGKTFKPLRPPHGDNHIVWIDPTNPRLLLEGNDGGATVSTDGGKTWSTEHNQPTGQFYHIAIDNRFPFHIFGAQQDEGSVDGPSATARGLIPTEDWKDVAYGESTFVAPQPDDPYVTYGSGYFSILMRYDMQTGQYQEVSPWPRYREGASSAELKYRFGWTHPIMFSPADPKELLVAAQYVLKSDDYGQTWQRISPDLTRNDPKTERPSGGPVDLDQSGAEIYPDISALAVSPLNGQVMWAGSADGLVHVTTDGGANWSAITPPALPQRAEITSIEASHTDPGTAYLSASRYMWDDFHPYAYKTTDYGKHWNTVTSGLPSGQYVFAVKQDPQSANLLFAGTKSTVYTSFDGGAHWQPLSLNLPHVQVRDIAIDTRQGDVAIATHGRAFWILDNLALLEQLAKNAPSAASAQVFAPQTAWLTHAYGAGAYAKRIPAVGMNPAFGATVFFNVPHSYNGATPAKLTFTDGQGKVVRTFTLHRASTAKKQSPEQLLTGIKPGMNSFQWDLRYPDATEVTGYKPPVAAGGLPDEVTGPSVIPGKYTVTLTYGGHSQSQSFDVALDPRLHADTDALAARLALQLRIHSTLDALDKSVNAAIAERKELQHEVALHHLTEAQARESLANLNQAISAVVQEQIKSSEGSLLHETKLRDHLAYLAADVDLAYDKPTASQYQVFDQLSTEEAAAQQMLASATTEGRTLGR